MEMKWIDRRDERERYRTGAPVGGGSVVAHTLILKVDSPKLRGNRMHHQTRYILVRDVIGQSNSNDEQVVM